MLKTSSKLDRLFEITCLIKSIERVNQESPSSHIPLLKKEALEIKKSLRGKIQKLSSSEQKIFELRYLKGKSIHFIASHLFYSTSTIYHKLSQICEKLS